MSEVKQVKATILTSATGRDPWHPLKADEVPAWVKDPDNMARLVKGEACMKCDEGPNGSNWYRAEVLEPVPMGPIETRSAH